MDPLSAALLGGTALVSGGLGLFGSSQQASASREAAQMQAQTAMMAMAQQQKQYEQTRADLSPYRDAGAGAVNMLTQRLPDLTTPFVADQATLQNAPGYQWNLAQGTKAAQSSAAARGLGLSGAALKGAMGYATGLADNTLQTQFNIDQANKTNAYNKLLGTGQLGASSAAQTGLLGANSANQQANLLTGMGSAMGQGAMGAANATMGGYNALGNSLMSAAMFGANPLAKAFGGSNTAGMYDPLKGFDYKNFDPFG